MPSRRSAALTTRPGRDADPPRKTGWQVRSSVADAVKQAVEKGTAESQNAFVERALVRELHELRRQHVYDAYAEAASDPLFLTDMEGVTRDLESVAADGLGDAE